MALNRLPDFQSHLSRHRHDVSQGYTSTLAPGALVPQYFDVLLPGDSVYYKTHLFARLQNVVTAFLGEIDLHVDYFFVPLQMMYLPSGSILTNTNEVISSKFKEPIYARFPLLDVMASASQPSNPFGFFTGHEECYVKELARLFDAFNLNPFVAISNEVTGTTQRPSASIRNDYCINPAIVPWIPCAYQAIYQKYYRNDELETFDVASYNFDQYDTAPTFVNNRMLRLRYIQRPNDYFTNIRVSPIFSAVNAAGNFYDNVEQYPENGGNPLGDTPNRLFSVLQWLGARPQDYYPQNYSEAYSTGDYSNDAFNNVGATQATELITDDNRTYLNANNIRALFALDKYQRIFGRAKKTYDDQILAHFGIHIPHDVKHDITHLKHYRCVLQAEPVIGSSYNGTETSSQLGQIGGQGAIKMETGEEKFTAPVHGVFMAIAYAVTKPRYVGTYSRLHDLYDFYQYPQPEFDKLGAEPHYAYESNPYYLHESNLRGIRDGWQNRYSAFKIKYNRASIYYMGKNVEFGSQTNENVFASWVLSKSPYYTKVNGAPLYQESHFVDAYRLFETPHALDGVMIVPYNGQWSDDYFTHPYSMFKTDPIVTEFMCFAKKVSFMSELGEPDL